MRRVMLRLRMVLGVVEYNYFFHSALGSVSSAETTASFHWHLEICPPLHCVSAMAR
jgi:UDPglucose--hexose-1-phosphate uridylyltransferase